MASAVRAAPDPGTLIGINAVRAMMSYLSPWIRRGIFVRDKGMDVSEAISGRRSVREYTAQSVDELTVDRLIDAAVKAPSAVNQQPWTFTVVRDQALLDRISRGAKAHMLATMQTSPHAGHFQSLLDDPSFQIFYHAPLLILISAVAEGPWIVEDCALAAENLMLSAYAVGLGTCWIGFAQSFLNTSDGKNLLGLPEAWVPIAPIIVGHAKGVRASVSHNKPQVHRIG
jgi:nitroreductase